MNPYADALAGLDLPDPLGGFFDFCRERESIRIRRERGEPAPWSEDPIFQNGRFLNVFREDDRGSKAIARFVAPAVSDDARLVHAALFARWCNHPVTLDNLEIRQLEDGAALKRALLTSDRQPWCNTTAYPVEPSRWDAVRISRLDTATLRFFDLRDELTAAIRSCERDIVRATSAVNGFLGLENDFPVFMAMVDIAGFRPDLLDPASHVPTGIGAAPYLDLLQAHLDLASHAATADAVIAAQPTLWPEAKRALLPIDVEYLSCECRKYWSYVNGTKTFTGKNVFIPGRTPLVLVDLPASGEPVQTRVHVLAGGPGSGKSTLANALEQHGFPVTRETSRVLIEGADEDPRVDPIAWQTRVIEADHALFSGLPTDELVIADTSFVENLVFADRAGVEVGPQLMAWVRARRHAKVFFLEPLERYENSDVRKESQQESARLSARIRQAYEDLGYELISVPDASVDERVELISAHLTT
ncbi:MAG: ATP-binding protein [Proteobacteria bacterium]|nr:ATP-binding protein [Pseudomonadota bacterium]MCP4916167.1 ATP-binding protein [Pseudomonadota bacterium]